MYVMAVDMTRSWKKCRAKEPLRFMYGSESIHTSTLFYIMHISTSTREGRNPIILKVSVDPN